MVRGKVANARLKYFRSIPVIVSEHVRLDVLPTPILTDAANAISQEDAACVVYVYQVLCLVSAFPIMRMARDYRGYGMHNSHVLYFDTSFTIGIYGVLHEQGLISYAYDVPADKERYVCIGIAFQQYVAAFRDAPAPSICPRRSGTRYTKMFSGKNKAQSSHDHTPLFCRLVPLRTTRHWRTS